MATKTIQPKIINYDKYTITFGTNTMKLNDFDKKDFARKALEENYKVSFDVSRMSIKDTKDMLKKVRGLALEAKQATNFHENQTSKSYMKLVFMEQALVSHYNKLASRPRPRIVFENEEVEKSQVVLAAQDLCDSIQKMLEEVGQMHVKELPALVDSIESEIGANESQSYNEQVSAQLETLSSALKEAFTQLKAARDGITGGGVPGAAFAGAEAGAEMGADMGAEMGADMGAEMGADMGAEPASDISVEEPPEAPEAQPVGGVGRAKR